MENMEIKDKFVKFLPDLIVVGMLVAFYFHTQGLNEQLYLLADKVKPLDNLPVEYDVEHEIWMLNKSINNIWIYFLMFIAVLNLYRKKFWSKET